MQIPVPCWVAPFHLTLFDTMECCLPGSSVHGDPAGDNTRVDCHALLQGIFPTHGSNPGLLHCRHIFLPSEPAGKPKNTGVGGLSLLQGIFLTQESNQDLLHCGYILYQLRYQGSPYVEHVMRNASLDESQAGIKIVRKNINKLRYADDTILMAENKKELKSLVMKVGEKKKKKQWKIWLKIQHPKY